MLAVSVSGEKGMLLAFIGWEAVTAISTSLMFVVAAVALLVAWWQIGIARSIRKTELIVKIYSAFVEDQEMADFYDRVRQGERLDRPGDRWRINRGLTIFDQVSFLETQGLLPPGDRVWEYIASEIQYFASNRSVCQFMEDRIGDAKEKKTFKKDDALPFTGFTAILARIPKDHQMTNYRCIPTEFKALHERLDYERRLLEKKPVCGTKGFVRTRAQQRPWVPP